MMNADTRRRIVMAAMELFAEKGFQSTSVADILSRTQVHSGSLYHVFPGKMDVLAAVLEAYRDGIESWLLAPAWSGVDDPIDRVFALLNAYRTGLVSSECTYACPIGSLALELHEPDPAIRALLAANFAGWTAAIARCLDAAGDRLPEALDRLFRPQRRDAAPPFRFADGRSAARNGGRLKTSKGGENA